MRRNDWSALAGATRYEFTMQLRRKAVWIIVGLFSLLALMDTGVNTPWQYDKRMPVSDVVATWALATQLMMPLAFGALLADRLPRDRRTRVDELLETLPGSPGARLLGKYAGSTLATMTPIFLVYCAGIGYVLARWGDWRAVPLGLAAFLAINLPGLLFVAGLSVAFPAVLWVPLYQILFVCYWFWGTMLSPIGAAIPTPSGTWLQPTGLYQLSGFFDVQELWVGRAAAWEGMASIALMLAVAALTLSSAHGYLRWRAARL